MCVRVGRDFLQSFSVASLLYICCLHAFLIALSQHSVFQKQIKLPLKLNISHCCMNKKRNMFFFIIFIQKNKEIKSIFSLKKLMRKLKILFIHRRRIFKCIFSYIILTILAKNNFVTVYLLKFKLEKI